MANRFGYLPTRRSNETTEFIAGFRSVAVWPVAARQRRGIIFDR
jgi:hypothetical protein